VRKDAVDISQVFFDDRDSNKSRPHCVIVKTPNPNGPNAWPRFEQVWRVRAASPEQAELIRGFLRQQRRTQRSLPNFLATVEEIMRGTQQIARNEATRRYELKLAIEANRPAPNNIEHYPAGL
jgi:hypothetical protein